MSIRLIGYFFTLFLVQPVWASQFSATITMLNGAAEIFVKPRSKANGPKPVVKFEGRYYTIRKARIGKKVHSNQVFKTGSQAKAKITFSNGDSVIIGPGTAVIMRTLLSKIKGGNKEEGQLLNIFYGKVRAIVSKNGPRNNLKVKTKTAVAGVRGTDFYVKYNPAIDQTQLSVLRGKVAVNTGEKSSVRATRLLKKGYTAIVKNVISSAEDIPDELPTKGQTKGRVDSQKIGAIAGFEKPIQITILSKEKLTDIQSTSNVTNDKESLDQVPSNEKDEIQKLEKKAIQVILDDIKVEDPEQFKKMEKLATKTASVDEINSVVVRDLQDSAPKETEVRKISEDELLRNIESGEDVYKKYFSN
tara:strand:- start:56451 stop:57530 length:1080 start_codon:yes stop_codon:yes gene_type:complete